MLPLAQLDRRHPARSIRSVWGVMRTARRIGASLIHANDVPSFQPGGYAARLLRIPAVTHVRFPDTNAGFSWFLRPGIDRALFVSESLRGDATAACPTLFARALGRALRRRHSARRGSPTMPGSLFDGRWTCQTTRLSLPLRARSRR